MPVHPGILSLFGAVTFEFCNDVYFVSVELDEKVGHFTFLPSFHRHMRVCGGGPRWCQQQTSSDRFTTRAHLPCRCCQPDISGQIHYTCAFAVETVVVYMLPASLVTSQTSWESRATKFSSHGVALTGQRRLVAKCSVAPQLLHGKSERQHSSQLPVEISVSFSHFFDHEMDSARQLQAHRRYLVELGVAAHVVSDLRQLVAATPKSLS